MYQGVLKKLGTETLKGTNKNRAVKKQLSILHD